MYLYCIHVYGVVTDERLPGTELQGIYFNEYLTISLLNKSGCWVVQSVEHPTLGFGSGHELRVMRSSP